MRKLINYIRGQSDKMKEELIEKIKSVEHIIRHSYYCDMDAIYLYSKIYDMNFRIQHRRHSLYFLDNSEIDISLFEIYDFEYINKIINNTILYVSTDGYNSDIGIFGNIPLKVDDFISGDWWISKSDYLSSKRDDILDSIFN